MSVNAISTFPYNLDVIAKVISLRDFFITLFFVSLGARIPRPSLEIALLALAGSAFLFLSRLLTVFPILRFLKNGNRASLIPALNLVIALGSPLRRHEKSQTSRYLSSKTSS
jgi:Kef-type K+ transport system membrane component KefB